MIGAGAGVGKDVDRDPGEDLALKEERADDMDDDIIILERALYNIGAKSIGKHRMYLKNLV